MTTASIGSISLAVGSSLAYLAARGAGWCATQMARSPMASTALILVSGLTLVAGTNALFMQDARHPAPLFGASFSSAGINVPPQVEPVVVTPVQRPEGLSSLPTSQPAPVSAQTPVQTPPTTTSTQSVASNADATQPTIGNTDIAEMQEKLKALGLFDGTVDGYYGPKTADSIRAFEQRAGLPRTGAATPQLIEAVRNAPLNTSQASAPVSEPAQPVRPEGLSVDQAGIGALISEFQEPAPAQPQQAAPTTVAQTPAQPAPAQPAPAPEPVQTAQAPATPPALDRELISDIQRGLSRLGFLQGPVSGTADENTARAIRKFQIFNNYAANGEVSPQVHQLLVRAGAFM